ncbi:MAG: PEGA domain-containing protein [Acidobacteria bacterium]|nr:PEGA domain-containing protein [Acidobacteriota bacterium]
MDPALDAGRAPSAPFFTDGLGERFLAAGPGGRDRIELTCLRGDLTSVPSFEFALRERASRLAGFRHACYAQVIGVERLKDRASTLALVCEHRPGTRLSDLLAFAERGGAPLDIDAALCLLRQLVPAVAMLHETAPDIAHGALAPERIVVAPGARLVIVEHALGAALEQLRFSHERYWKELHVALPRSAGAPRFDHRADVMQIGLVALALILGRPVGDDEFPARIPEVVASTWAISARGGLEPLPAGLRAWLTRALQLDSRNWFRSAIEAQEDLERVLGESDYLAAPSTLEAFFAHYHAAAAREAPPTAAPAALPSTASPTPIAAPAFELTPARPGPAEAAGRTGAHAGVPTPATQVVPNVHRGSASAEQGAAVRTTAATAADAPGGYSAKDHGWSARIPAVGVREPGIAPPSPAAAAPAVPRGAPPAPMPQPAAPMPPPATQPAPAAAARKDAAPRLRAEPEPAEPGEPVEDERGRGGRWPRVAAAVALLAVGAGGLAAARWYVAAPAAAVPKEGTLVVNTTPPGARLFVDGVDRGTTPQTLTLNAGTHSMEVRGDGAPRAMPITVAAGGQVTQFIDLPKGPATLGDLQVKTDPQGARITVDGVARGVAPITVEGLQPGAHEVLVESDLRSVRQMVVVEAGVAAALMVPLGAPDGAPVSGWIAVSAPADVQVFEGGRLVGSSESERLMVAAGRHDLEIVNETLGYRSARTVQVGPGRVTPINVEFPKGRIALNATPWAEVWIDGAKIGETPIGNHELTIGPHEIVFRNPDLGEQRHAVTITADTPGRLSVDLRKR